MIHHVFANRSNAGDWLSALGIQALLGRNDIVEHLCDEPFVPATIEALQSAGADDFVVIGGGGLFMDYFMPFWEGFGPIAERVPFCIWGVGVCDMVLENSLPSAGLIRSIVDRSRLCIVRDDLTRQFVGRPQLPASIACPTFAMVMPRPARSRGTVLHVDHFSDIGEANFEKMEAFAEEHARRTGRTKKKINNLIPADDRKALEATLDSYDEAELVLTSRLHGCIIATAMGRPFLAVSGDRKIDSFMRAAGLERWLCPLADVDSVPDRLRELDCARPLAAGFTGETRRRNRDVAVTVLQLLRELPAR